MRLLRGDTTRYARSELLTTGVRRARNPPLGIFAEAAGAPLRLHEEEEVNDGAAKVFYPFSSSKFIPQADIGPELLVELTSKRALDLCKT